MPLMLSERPDIDPDRDDYRTCFKKVGIFIKDIYEIVDRYVLNQFEDQDPDDELTDSDARLMAVINLSSLNQTYNGHQLQELVGPDYKVNLTKKTIKCIGQLNELKNWSAYGENDQMGYFVVLDLYAPTGYTLSGHSLTGTEIVYTFGETGDGANRIILVKAVDPNLKNYELTLTDPSGSLNSTTYTLDISGCTFVNYEFQE